MDRFKVAKHLRLTITEEAFFRGRDEKARGFQALPSGLRAITRDLVHPVGRHAEGAFAFDSITSPTPSQGKAPDLLGVPLTPQGFQWPGEYPMESWAQVLPPP